MSSKNPKLAKRYARALFSICKPEQHDQAVKTLKFLSQLWQQNSDFRELFNNPVIRVDERTNALTAIIESSGIPAEQWLNDFLKVLSTADRFALIPEVEAIFQELVNEYRKHLAVQVTSVSGLATDEKEKITGALSKQLGASVTVEWKEDPSIIGGLVLRFGDVLIDRSVSGAIDQLKGHLVS